MTKPEVLDQPISPQILHRVEYIKFVIYGIVKKIILKIQILYLIHLRNWISQWTRLKKAITGGLRNILNGNENNVSPSNQNLKSFKLQETFYNHLTRKFFFIWTRLKKVLCFFAVHCTCRHDLRN